ncbi:MAG: hypothetical protein AABY44_05015 [Nitrospirota bacterium]
MLKCPFCDSGLSEHTEEEWKCACGEIIPFGFEINSDENCETCPVIYCPNRRKPTPEELKALKDL